MLKLFTSMAAMVVAVSAFADLPVLTPDPAQGKVESLTKITFAYPEGYVDFENLDFSAITVSRDSQDITAECQLKASYYAPEINFGNPQTTPGTYVVKIPEGVFDFYDDSFRNSPNAELNLTYIIEGEPVATGVVLTATPAPGTVESLTKIALAYPDEYPDFDNVDFSAITVTRDSQDITADCKLKSSYSSPLITFGNPQNTPGTYVVKIPEGVFEFYDESYSSTTPNAALELTYTIEGAPVANGVVLTATPAPGTVESLTKIALAYPDEYPDFDNVDFSAITVTRDSQDITADCKLKSSYNSPLITFGNPQTTPGTYVVKIPEGVFEFYDESYSSTTPNAALELTYTIEGAPVANGVVLTATPAPGTVESLSLITLAPDGEYEDFDVVNFSEITVTRNGTDITKDCNLKNTYGTLNIKFNNEQTEDGRYVVTIPEGVFSFTNDSWASETYSAELILVYTIGESGPVYDLTVTSTNPKAGEVDIDARQFETVNFNMSDASARPAAGAKAIMECETLGYREECNVRYNFGSQCTVTLPRMLTKNGTYTLTIPQGTFGDAEWIADPKTGHANATFTCNFICVGGEGSEATYDVEVIKTNPAANSEVDLEMKQFDSVTLTVPAGMNVREDSPMATLVCEGANYSSEGKLRFTMNDFSGNAQLLAGFTNVSTNGVYTLTVPRGTFGDAAWQADATTGHCNDTFTCTFTVVGGAAQTTATLDLMPESITPDAEQVTSLEQIVVVFPAGTSMVGNAQATLSCTETNYYENILIRAAEEEGTFTITPNQAPSRAGTYMLIIKAEQFGDADYIANNKTGHANAEITHTWLYSPEGSVAGITAEEAAEGVYNFQGIRVADDLKSLPAGIYILKGKKIIKK